MTEIKFSRENERVVLPSRKEGDAGWDLYVDLVWLDEKCDGSIRIKPNETVMMPTGLRSIINPKYYAQIQERGSTGFRGMKYGAGVIDSSYRGIWNVVITNCNNCDIIICSDTSDVSDLNDNDILYPSNKGIAQFVLLPVPEVEIKEVSVEDILSNKTHRGEGKLGSSGK